MVSQLIVRGSQAPLSGSVPVPVDDEVLKARIALASLSRGRSSFAAKGVQQGTLVLLDALACLGVRHEFVEQSLFVHGRGLKELSEPKKAIDLRGFPDVAGIMLGLCVSRSCAIELWVDPLVSELLVPVLGQQHELDAQPLEEREGVRIACSPLTGSSRPGGLDAVCHGVFPWVKQALLLAGLRAGTPTTVEEKLASSDHLERALLRSRVPFSGEGTVATLHPPRDEDALSPMVCEHLGSSALAAPLCAAAALLPQSRLMLRDVGQNPTRSDFFVALRLMGNRTTLQPTGDRQGEPVGNLLLEAGGLRGVSLSGETVFRLKDEALFLLPLMAIARGQSRLRDVVPQTRGGDLRVLQRAAGFLRSAGVTVSLDGEFLVEGSGGDALRELTVTTGGDPRLALLGTVFALAARGESVIDDVDCLRSHFPRWVGTLRALGAAVEVKTA